MQWKRTSYNIIRVYDITGVPDLPDTTSARRKVHLPRRLYGRVDCRWTLNRRRPA